jgi:arylsulfatase B
MRPGRLHFLLLSGLIAFTFSCGALGAEKKGKAARPAARADAPRPNIVLLIADDLGYGEPGCQGGRDVPTPNLDRLATEGIRFTQGYVTASVCAPSRAAMFTGRYQTRFGFEGNAIGAANADPKVGLPTDQRTLAQRLRETGYATALVGKWHLGGTAPLHPLRRGYDEFFGFLHEGHYYTPVSAARMTTWLRRTALPDGGTGRWTSPDGRMIWSTHLGNKEPDYDADNPILRGSQPENETAHLTDAFTREACNFIERHSTQPFFLTLAYNAVHSPMQAADRFLEKFSHIPDIHRRIFAAILAQLDESVGLVLAQLHAHGLEENTLVVFLSDNGGPTRELTSSNAPLRGEKGSLYEGGVRVPFILRWPRALPQGGTVETPVISLDLAATALAAAGIAASSGELDGTDLVSLVKAPPAEPRPFFWRMGQRRALRLGDWKIVRDAGPRQAGPWQLFNLATDLGETTDLAAREPARLEALVKRWEEWDAAQRDPLW